MPKRMTKKQFPSIKKPALGDPSYVRETLHRSGSRGHVTIRHARRAASAELAIAVVVVLDGERYHDECDAREDGEQDD
jgi:hypothetical protein